MDFKIIWTEEAEETFGNIVKYLDEHWTEKEIIHLLFRLEKFCHLIKKYPRSFRRSKKKNFHEVLISKQNLLIYRVKKNEVILITFWDTRRDPKKLKI